MNMQALLFGTIFLFATTCGIILRDNLGNGLIKDAIPCKSNNECESRIRQKSECMNESCKCFKNGSYHDCRLSISEIMDFPSIKPRINEPSSLGSKCVSNSDCRHKYLTCSVTNHCVCINGYVGTLNGQNCLKVATTLGESCEDNVQCTFKFPNSTCLNSQKCACSEDYHEADSQCWKNIGLGGNCKDGRECSYLNANCSKTSNTCICDGERVMNDRGTMCLDVVGNGERCLQSIQCKKILGEAECIHNYCRCSRMHHYVDMKKKCVPSKTIGQPCEEDNNCFETSRTDDTNFLICGQAKVCICGNGFERIGDECEETADSSSSITRYSTILFLVSFFLFLS